jgi:hypothetical protein
VVRVRKNPAKYIRLTDLRTRRPWCMTISNICYNMLYLDFHVFIYFILPCGVRSSPCLSNAYTQKSWQKTILHWFLGFWKRKRWGFHSKRQEPITQSRGVKSHENTVCWNCVLLNKFSLFANCVTSGTNGHSEFYFKENHIKESDKESKSIDQ